MCKGATSIAELLLRSQETRKVPRSRLSFSDDFRTASVRWFGTRLLVLEIVQHGNEVPADQPPGANPVPGLHLGALELPRQAPRSLHMQAFRGLTLGLSGRRFCRLVTVSEQWQ